MRNYDEILKKLETNKEYHECFLELLEKIEIKRKKDGTHFQNKNQTFINANYTGNVDNTIKYPELKLVGRDKRGIWQEYSINCYLFADELPKDDERRNKALTGGYTRDCYNLTTDEIIEKIESEKEFQKAYIKQYDEQIENSKRIFDVVSAKVQELSELIKSETDCFRELSPTGKKIYPSSLEYALQDYVKDNIR